MPKLTVFSQLTIDGYFAGENSDVSWAHQNQDAEWNGFVEGNAKSGNALLFGRVTYEMMASFWPTPQAAKMNPVVAEAMTAAPKLVVSKTLEQANWKNTTIIKSDFTGQVRRLKQGSGKDMTILGSGSIVSQLAQEGLIDEYHVVINPVVLGRGRSLFEGMEKPLKLTLAASRVFRNGNVVLSYQSRS